MNPSSSKRGSFPYYEADLFTDEALKDPFGHYRAIRDAGSVVRLKSPQALALSRFEDVQAALRADDVLISGKGVGFNEVVNAPTEQPSLIQSDGDRHRRLRRPVAKPLMPAALRERREMLKTMISTRIQSLVDAASFDGVSEIAQFLPVQAVSHLVGLPEEGRSSMLRWAAASFNALAPTDDEDSKTALADDLTTFAEAKRYFESVEPARLRPGSWVDMLFQAVDRGSLQIGEARAAMSGLVNPSLDTTINAAAHLMYNLGKNPDQWDLLRNNPALIRSAVFEGVRYSAVVRWFSRFAERDYDVAGTTIPAGSRVMIMYASANRDERRYRDPDRFDVTRNPTDQLGWGTGPHMCVGMHLAQIEMEVLLEALIEQVERIEVGEPKYGVNRALYGIDRLPMRLHGSV